MKPLLDYWHNVPVLDNPSLDVLVEKQNTDICLTAKLEDCRIDTDPEHEREGDLDVNLEVIVDSAGVRVRAYFPVSLGIFNTMTFPSGNTLAAAKLMREELSGRYGSMITLGGKVEVADPIRRSASDYKVEGSRPKVDLSLSYVKVPLPNGAAYEFVVNRKELFKS